jgi:precorrin-2 dehydrogenase/sirohydrochlorin ferrochelatase
MPNYYPIMLDVRGRQAIVVGGNPVAAEKAAALCACGARVIVLSPDFCTDLISMAHKQLISLWQKVYEPGDLATAFVVVAATTYDAQLTEAIWQETQQRGQLVNIVDVPARCNFIVPSILRRDQLTIAVSTEGSSPGLAKRIRQQLEKFFPPAYGTFLRIAAAARTYLRKNGLSYARRDEFFGDYYNSAILDYLVKGEQEKALVETQRLLARYTVLQSSKDTEHTEGTGDTEGMKNAEALPAALRKAV